MNFRNIGQKRRWKHCFWFNLTWPLLNKIKQINLTDLHFLPNMYLTWYTNIHMDVPEDHVKLHAKQYEDTPKKTLVVFHYLPRSIGWNEIKLIRTEIQNNRNKINVHIFLLKALSNQVNVSFMVIAQILNYIILSVFNQKQINSRRPI